MRRHCDGNRPRCEVHCAASLLFVLGQILIGDEWTKRYEHVKKFFRGSELMAAIFDSEKLAIKNAATVSVLSKSEKKMPPSLKPVNNVHLSINEKYEESAQARRCNVDRKALRAPA